MAASSPLKMKKPVILLVHGAWHAPGYYKPLITSLRGAGYTVVAPQLATAGPDDSILGKSVPDDVRRCEEALAPYLSCSPTTTTTTTTNSSSSPPPSHEEGPAEAAADREVVVLAHSYGGVPATQFCHGNTIVERKAKDLTGGVKGIVYLAAFALAEAGMKIADLEPVMDFFDIDQGTGVTKLKPLAVQRLYAADVPDPMTRQAMYALLGDHSALAFLKPVTHGAAQLPSPGKTYIVCSRDECIFPEMQREMAAAIDADKVVEIDAGHSAFLVDAHVERIVREIESVAGQV